jgi:hypothetical protein
MRTISLLSIFVVVVAQQSTLSQIRPHQRTPAKPAAEKPVTVQMATTDDGKRIELRSDGTWKYIDSAPTAPANRVTSTRTTILSIEAGLVFKSGDIKPVARTEFHLLDESLSKILRDAGLQPRAGDTDASDHGVIFSYGLARKYGADSNFPAAVQEAVSKHVIQTTTSGFDGKGKFNPVPQGTYYVFAMASTPKGFVIWNVKVELNSAEVSITLDQNNAEIAI